MVGRIGQSCGENWVCLKGGGRPCRASILTLPYHFYPLNLQDCDSKPWDRLIITSGDVSMLASAVEELAACVRPLPSAARATT